MSLTAVLFAGGLSQRMGTDKATLVIEREPLWQKQLNRLHELKPQGLWISARERPPWCPPNIETVIDETPSRGPLSGLTASLDRLQTSHLLVLAIDLPRMTAEQLRKLCTLAEPGRGAIPLNGEIFEPLCAIYPIEAAATARAALAAADLSLQRLAQTLVQENRAIAYPLSDREKEFFHNVNTPADLSGLR
jgi:molybdopterin-guanine dinucleotide biosynthesis protein A